MGMKVGFMFIIYEYQRMKKAIEKQLKKKVSDNIASRLYQSYKIHKILEKIDEK